MKKIDKHLIDALYDIFQNRVSYLLHTKSYYCFSIIKWCVCVCCVSFLNFRKFRYCIYPQKLCSTMLLRAFLGQSFNRKLLFKFYMKERSSSSCLRRIPGILYFAISVFKYLYVICV